MKRLFPTCPAHAVRTLRNVLGIPLSQAQEMVRMAAAKPKPSRRSKLQQANLDEQYLPPEEVTATFAQLRRQIGGEDL